MSKRATMQSCILIVKKRKQIDFPMVMASGIYLSAHTNDSNRVARDVSLTIFQLLGNPGLKCPFFILDIHIIDTCQNMTDLFT